MDKIIFAGISISSFALIAFIEMVRATIKTREHPVIGRAILWFISKKHKHNIFGPYYSKTEFYSIDGASELYDLPIVDFEYSELSWLILGLKIKIVSGERPDEYVYEISGTNCEKRLKEIIEEFNNLFYTYFEKEDLIRIPQYKLFRYWDFRPQTIKTSHIRSYKKYQLDTQSGIIERFSNKEIRGIILERQSKIYSSLQEDYVKYLAYKMKRPIYEIDTQYLGDEKLIFSSNLPVKYLDDLMLLLTIQIIDEKSIIFFNTLDYKFGIDLLVNTITDIIPADTFIVFGTKNKDLYKITSMEKISVLF